LHALETSTPPPIALVLPRPAVMALSPSSSHSQENSRPRSPEAHPLTLPALSSYEPLPFNSRRPADPGGSPPRGGCPSPIPRDRRPRRRAVFPSSSSPLPSHPLDASDPGDFQFFYPRSQTFDSNSRPSPPRSRSLLRHSCNIPSSPAAPIQPRRPAFLNILRSRSATPPSSRTPTRQELAVAERLSSIPVLKA
jgi:hypothetical protein